MLSPCRFRWSRQTSGILVLLFGCATAVEVSCRSSHEVTRAVAVQPQPARRTDPYLAPGFPRGNKAFRQVSLQPLGARIPVIEGAEYVNDDEFCAQCHEAYHKSFLAQNVHRNESCESCHGPASRHLETRGREPGLIFSFKSGDPVVRAEACLKCHEQHQCTAGAQWRTSVHAHRGVTCVNCHRGHHDVPFGTPATTATGGDASAPPQPMPPLAAAPLGAPTGISQISALMHPPTRPAAPHPAPATVAFYPTAQVAVPPPPTNPAAPAAPPVQGMQAPPQVALVAFDAARTKQDGEGYVRPTRNLPSLLGTSQHMGAIAPGVCFQCHGDMRDLQQIAGPHQIGGPNDFNCTTCHNPHGQILETTRKDLCLKCHQGAPTMAWHSSVHNLTGVACTDCHNPHPRSTVPRVVNISHTDIRRPKRLPMSVDDPSACYKCHPRIYAEFALPSHHPLPEGKMLCADCHDPHGETIVTDGRGQGFTGLRGATVNLVCYRCHAEKQGPFVFEHPPVTENCDICHTPHGAVTNNLLRQPTTFLCLRCHSGHRKDNRSPDLTIFAGNPGGVPLTAPHPTGAVVQSAQYTDCTQCHAEIHGTDIPSNSGRGTFFR